MKKTDLLEALGDVNEKYLNEAQKRAAKAEGTFEWETIAMGVEVMNKTALWKKKAAPAAAIAAVFVLAVGTVAYMAKGNGFGVGVSPSSNISADESQKDETTESTSKDPSTNFLGGAGALEIIDNRNALFMQDDEWYYVGSFKMKKESVGMRKMISQCREAGCLHSNSECILNQYYYGGNELLSDGRDLYLASDNTLLTIDSKGNTDTVLQFKTSPNGVSLEKGTFQFSELQRIDETHIYVEAEAYTTNEAYVRFYSICDLSDGSIMHIRSEIMPGVIFTDSVTGQCYCISSEGRIIRVNPQDMREEIVTEQLDDFPTWDGWAVHDDILYYINRMGQYCQYDLNLREKTLLYDISPFETYILHDDMIYTLSDGSTKILRGDYAWTEYEEVYATDSIIRSIIAVNDEVLFFSQDDGGRLLLLENGEVMQYVSEE